MLSQSKESEEHLLKLLNKIPSERKRILKTGFLKGKTITFINHTMWFQEAENC